MTPEELIDSLSGTRSYESDAEFNIDVVSNHEKCYTDILRAYSENLEKTLVRKLFYKKCIFWLSFALLIIFPILILAVIIIIAGFQYYGCYINMAEWCSIIIPALISFLTVFIVIPKVITQYLFNSNEEKYMSDIIKHIQDYDKKS